MALPNAPEAGGPQLRRTVRQLRKSRGDRTVSSPSAFLSTGLVSLRGNPLSSRARRTFSAIR